MSTVVITGSNHIITPNSPRNSKHQIIRFKEKRQFYNFERVFQKIWRPLEGVSFLSSLACDRYDLIHSFNTIPYTNRPWIITFESILPRTIGYQGDKLNSLIIDRLVLDNCRKIIAMSKYAKEKFISTNKNFSGIKKISEKVEIISPSFPIRSLSPKQYQKGETLEIVFVGNDFARKGGIVALRLAEKAKQMKLPIKVHLVSAMNYGPQVYTDCTDISKYDNDMKLLELDNVVFHKKLLNTEVLNLLSKSHFQVMCTLDDTYGFSILEGFSVGTPAIVTNVCALPEFVHSNNGHIIDLELTPMRNWIHLNKRNQENYWSIVDSTYEMLSAKVLEFLIKIINNPQSYEALSMGAIEQAKIHDSNIANDLFDNFYQKISQQS